MVELVEGNWIRLAVVLVIGIAAGVFFCVPIYKLFDYTHGTPRPAKGPNGGTILIAPGNAVRAEAKRIRDIQAKEFIRQNLRTQENQDKAASTPGFIEEATP